MMNFITRILTHVLTIKAQMLLHPYLFTKQRKHVASLYIHLVTCNKTEINTDVSENLHFIFHVYV